MTDKAKPESPSAQNEREGLSAFEPNLEDYEDYKQQLQDARAYGRELEGLIEYMSLLVQSNIKLTDGMTQYMHPSIVQKVQRHNVAARHQISSVRDKMLAARQKLNYVKE